MGLFNGYVKPGKGVSKKDVAENFGNGNFAIVGLNVGGTHDFGERMHRLFACRHSRIYVYKC